MPEPRYRIAALYRRFPTELLAFQLETGKFFYFTPTSESFFDYFSEPRTLPEFYEAAGIPDGDLEKAYLEEFTELLIRQKILSPVDSPEMGQSQTFRAVKYCRPAMLRETEKNLEDVALLFCWISGPNTSQTST